jgi:hypothetical protein
VGETGETGLEMINKAHLNGSQRQPFLKKPTVDYALGSVSSAVTESTHLNPKETFHLKDISQ